MKTARVEATGCLRRARTGSSRVCFPAEPSWRVGPAQHVYDGADESGRFAAPSRFALRRMNRASPMEGSDRPQVLAPCVSASEDEWALAPFPDKARRAAAADPFARWRRRQNQRDRSARWRKSAICETWLSAWSSRDHGNVFPETDPQLAPQPNARKVPSIRGRENNHGGVCAQPAPFRSFSSCGWRVSLAARMSPVSSIRALPARSDTMPPASRTMRMPAATSHAFKPRSQKPS